MSKFRAYRINKQDDGIVAGFEEMAIDDLTEGNVVIKVSHSTINYKDALAATGTAPILRRYPLNGGIDLAGVVESSDHAELQPGTPVLNRALATEPESLDPQKSRSVQAADVLRDIGEGLVSYDASGTMVPATAESWEISADGLTYTFLIRPQARWSNGDPVTAADFVFGLQRLVDPATAAFRKCVNNHPLSTRRDRAVEKTGDGRDVERSDNGIR